MLFEKFIKFEQPLDFQEKLQVKSTSAKPVVLTHLGFFFHVSFFFFPFWDLIRQSGFEWTVGIDHPFKI